ncbi:ABC transporter ATP-binding protein [Bacillus sp. A116_S68]|nr:ABC transporter ATP-binding protein [Bacillus sp. A116_S68]
MITLNKINKTVIVDNTEINILEDINLDFKKGEFVSIMGKSGSGKTTLMNIIGTLDSPTSGELIIEEGKVNLLDKDELSNIRKDKIGFVFQHFNLLNRLTNYENVALPLIYKSIKPKDRKEMVENALKQVGLKEKIYTIPTKLSGGQKQRVAIARAIVSSPSILLADEPTGALDSKTSEEIMDLFNRLNKSGKTIVLVTHDEEIAKKTNKVVTIADGKVKVIRSINNVYT